MKTAVWLTLAGVTLSGCALKGDVRRVERQLVTLQTAIEANQARADSVRAAEVGRIIAILASVQDSLVAHQRALTVMRGELRSDLTDVQRQLVQIQELTGQSQQRLSEMRTQLEQRGREPLQTPQVPDTTRAAADPALPGPDQLYDLGLQQLRRGSPATARGAFQQFLQAYGTHPRVPDALFQLGETWAGTNADSAAQAYEAVVRGHPNSTRAPGALYKLGLLAEQRGDRDAARGYYQRVLSSYPRSEEASLAREKLRGTP